MSSIPAQHRNQQLPKSLKHLFSLPFNEIASLLYDPQGSFFYVLFAGRLEEFYGPFNARNEVENFAKDYTRFLNQSFGFVSNQRGQDAENRALKILWRSGLNARIASQDEEKLGYDIIIKENSKEFPIQVKSSKESLRDHRKYYPNVPAFVINEAKRDQDIADEFRRYLRAQLFNVTR